MKNALKTIGIITFTVIIALTLTAAGCDNGTTSGGGGSKGSGNKPPVQNGTPLNNTSYTWTDGGTNYNLIISEIGARAAVTSGNFLLLITTGSGTASISGTAAGSGNDIILTSSSDSVTLTITGSALTVSNETFAGKTITSGTVIKKDGNTGSSNNPFIGMWKEYVDPILLREGVH
jgi:hypothetical protein